MTEVEHVIGTLLYKNFMTSSTREDHLVAIDLDYASVRIMSWGLAWHLQPLISNRRRMCGLGAI
jgi:hypothetical protein